MATIEKTYDTLTANGERFRTVMPSRAKYFYNTESEVSEAASKLRYGNFGTDKFDLQDFEDVKIKNEELKRDISTGNPDILPTGATLKMLKNSTAPAKPFDSTETVTYKVNAKGKLFFALYAVLVLALILVIVVNAMNIERQKSGNASIEGQITLMSASVSGLQTKAQDLSDDSYIKSEAAALGMTPIKVKNVKIEKPQLVEKAQADSVTNWFDSFCDMFN